MNQYFKRLDNFYINIFKFKLKNTFNNLISLFLGSVNKLNFCIRDLLI